MHITFYIGSLGGGGAERVVCNISNYLIEKGHLVEILTMAEANAGYSLDDRVLRTCLLSNTERKNVISDNVKRVIRLKKHMRTSRTDCYVVMLPITTILMLMFRHTTEAKVIAAERVDPANYSRLKKAFLKVLAPRADKWIFQTNEIQNWYGDRVKENKRVVIPNAINPAFIRQEYTGIKEKRIVGVGRLTDQKNFRLLIDAFAQVAPEFPDYKLVIYGEGPNRSMFEQQVQDLGLEGRVELPGYVEDIVEQLEKSYLFVLSSDFEGMPNALMEAMALGLPCISTDCGGGGARFLIDDGINGVLVPINNTSRMSAAIKAILLDENKAESLSRSARKIRDSLAPQVIYDKWETVIQSLQNG